MKKYKVWLYAEDYLVDMTIAYLRYWIKTEKIKVLGIATNKARCFRKWNEFECFSLDDVKESEYDYIIACDFRYDSVRMKELLSEGFERDKIIAGKALESPFFDFEKWEKVHQCDISIISQHCWGGVTYSDLQLPFKSPTINLFFAMDDFFKFVDNLEEYLVMPLEYKEMHKDLNYPIAKLGDIILYFNHHRGRSFEDARNEWDKRRKRVNLDNILVQAPLYNDEQVEKFKKITYRKIGFYMKETNCKDIITLDEFNDPYVNELYRGRFYDCVMDTSYQNKSKRFPRKYDPYKLLLGEDDFLV